MNPLVSILIPSYNSEKWIKSTIEAALAQTWKNKEIIIVDDGSTDNSYSIAKQYESGILKVITQDNSGACVARNRALSISQGDFIQWLDSDDILAPDKIEIQLTNSDQSPQTKVLHSSAFGLFYFRIEKAKFNLNPLCQDLSPLNWLLMHMGKGYWMIPAAWLVSRKLTDLAGPWDERLLLNQDGEYFCRVVASSELIKFHPDARSYYRQGNLSSVSSIRAGKSLDSLNLSKSLCVDLLLKLEDSDITREACVNYLQRSLFFPNNLDSPIIESNRKRIIELGGTIDPPAMTRKFTFIKNIFGLKTARIIKNKLWHLEIIIRKYWDKMFAKLYRDGI